MGLMWMGFPLTLLNDHMILWPYPCSIAYKYESNVLDSYEVGFQIHTYMYIYLPVANTRLS